MTHYGTLKDTVIAGSAEDIRRTHLYGLNDDKLGKISDVIFDHSTGDIRYVVADTGGWLSAKKFLVPAEALRISSKHNDDFEAYLTKQQIEMFPPFDQSDLESDAKWSGYEEKYRAKWVADPVMHRAETDRNVTPTTKQSTGNLQSEQAAAKAHGQPISERMRPVSTACVNAARRLLHLVEPVPVKAQSNPGLRVLKTCGKLSRMACSEGIQRFGLETFGAAHLHCLQFENNTRRFVARS